MAAEPEDHPDVQVFDEIRYIEHLVRTAIARKLPVGLNYPQFEVMNLLSRRGDGITPLEIARALQMTKSGLTNTLQRLCARKLTRVEHCEADGRKKRIWLTAEGKQAYSQAMAAIRPRMESLRDGFTQKEFREALPFLKALRTWLGEMHEASVSEALKA
ncbi:MarR family winged helix-turn-helix transcriptional regulator [Phenylobacterium sp.]|jgi:DNA-binding MarR family transcriptional regulator|uniref:MarR family winged helix-turn-helix transcriptional regulator n=1 Tax=Phenylobacterium sp. TaxID=1871053 RepID=UPI002E37E002|nr:MarR family transcriptional regulator [Phenylobacterium sp.]HEX3364436.1 MarR family transcriptional regulator [Phenylobacterium sp.]